MDIKESSVVNNSVVLIDAIYRSSIPNKMFGATSQFSPDRVDKTYFTLVK